MGSKLAIAALAVLTAACGAVPTAAPGTTGDALCDAVNDVRAAGLAAGLAAPLRMAGSDDADARAAEAREALARLREAAPPAIADDTDRVADELERFVTILNDPVTAPEQLLDRFAAGPQEHQAFVSSARRVNAVTQDRCGEALVDPGALTQPASG